MDSTDRRIIELLSQNARRSNVEMAKELGVSEGTVRKRVDRLMADGVLRIVGLADPEALGLATHVLICVSVETKHIERTSELLCAMPEVVNVYWTTGEYDFTIEAVFADDSELQPFLTERLGRVPGVISSQVAHVLRQPKRSGDWAVPPAPRPTVLIVDDDPDFVETTRIVLESADYRVTSAVNGDQALYAMIARPADLVIMDIMMDGVLDGWDATWRIRSNPNLRHTPILVVSSITATDYLSMFPTDDDNLIDNFLSKPVSPKRLLAEAKRLLAAS